ncbi:TIGR03067 domain-containing protein [uncultured Gimesia sp.]|uniref:TIGR03067 domain-containing protein n=1 Tax=uncultured Gimesia sp. TaxID=1678688 RepID=UPI00261B0406|nr:TIGR03067 domain-containing protein [uncultured Gimesia sp.]
MKRSHFGLMLVGAFAMLTSMSMIASADDAKEAAIRKDRQRIAGTWRIVALEINGNKSKDEDVRKMTVVNGADGTWSLSSEGNEIVKGTSTIDPTQNPKAIDITPTTGEDEGKSTLGIYELGKKTRKLCFASAGKSRPTEFTSTPENQQILVTFEKEKTK